MFLPHPRVKVSIVGSLRDREVACSASDRQGSNFESCVWRKVSSQSSHHPQEVLLAQFSLYVHKGGLKPDSFHFISFALSRFLHDLSRYPWKKTHTKNTPNAGSMVGHRLRCCPTMEPALVCRDLGDMRVNPLAVAGGLSPHYRSPGTMPAMRGCLLLEAAV